MADRTKLDPRLIPVYFPVDRPRSPNRAPSRRSRRRSTSDTGPSWRPEAGATSARPVRC